MPNLISPRLTLLPVTSHDVPALHHHWTDPDVRRYLWDDQVIPIEQVREIVEQSNRLFAEHRYGLWVIRRQESEGLIGCGGYWEFHDPPQLELIISLSPEHWGNGFAAEAGGVLVRYAFDQLGFDEVRASTDAPNAESLRLIERLGFQFSRRTDSSGLDTVFFTRAASPADRGGH